MRFTVTVGLVELANAPILFENKKLCIPQEKQKGNWTICLMAIHLWYEEFFVGGIDNYEGESPCR